MRKILALAFVTGALLSSSAAFAADIVVSDQPITNDPYEGFNRHVDALNRHLFNPIIDPIAHAYVKYFPKGMQNGVHNFVVNIGEPVTAANHLAQGHPGTALSDFGRLVLNSTAGLGGIGDPAHTSAGLDDHPTDAGITFGTWGIGPGPYLVLPILGPSDVRDLAGKVTDAYMNPLTYAHYHGSAGVDYGRYGLAAADSLPSIEALRDVERNSADLYATDRSLFTQDRRSAISGKTDVPPM